MVLRDSGGLGAASRIGKLDYARSRLDEGAAGNVSRLPWFLDDALEGDAQRRFAAVGVLCLGGATGGRSVAGCVGVGGGGSRAPFRSLAGSRSRARPSQWPSGPPRSV